MRNNKTNSRQKIIDKALELFYKQGYLATGINQVIAESGIAKNTFYYYFPSKDDLCVSYLKEMDEMWIVSIKSQINSCKDALDKLFAPIEFLRKWNKKNDYRGCPFLNIASEITDTGSEIRKEIIYHKERFKTIIGELVADLRNSNKKYSNVDIEFITEMYYLVAEGAIVTSQTYNETKPFDAARKNIEKLLNP